MHPVAATTADALRSGLGQGGATSLQQSLTVVPIDKLQTKKCPVNRAFFYSRDYKL
jgi:hypothetical protein